jgi:hypothetical protein
LICTETDCTQSYWFGFRSRLLQVQANRHSGLPPTNWAELARGQNFPFLEIERERKRRRRRSNSGRRERGENDREEERDERRGEELGHAFCACEVFFASTNPRRQVFLSSPTSPLVLYFIYWCEIDTTT